VAPVERAPHFVSRSEPTMRSSEAKVEHQPETGGSCRIFWVDSIGQLAGRNPPSGCPGV
jgi:hypothetical protein